MAMPSMRPPIERKGAMAPKTIKVEQTGSPHAAPP